MFSVAIEPTTRAADTHVFVRVTFELDGTVVNDPTSEELATALRLDLRSFQRELRRTATAADLRSAVPDYVQWVRGDMQAEPSASITRLEALDLGMHHMHGTMRKRSLLVLPAPPGELFVAFDHHEQVEPMTRKGHLGGCDDEIRQAIETLSQLVGG